MAKTFGTLTAPKSGPRARSKPNSAQSESRSLGGSIYASTVLSLDADGPHEEDQPLNDQQWGGSTFHVILTIRNLHYSLCYVCWQILQRKKIGLSRRTKRSLNTVNQSESKNRHLASFLRSFKRKECIRYVSDPNAKVRLETREARIKNAENKSTTTEKACFCGALREEHKTR